MFSIRLVRGRKRPLFHGFHRVEQELTLINTNCIALSFTAVLRSQRCQPFLGTLTEKPLHLGQVLQSLCRRRYTSTEICSVFEVALTVGVDAEGIQSLIQYTERPNAVSTAS